MLVNRTNDSPGLTELSGKTASKVAFGPTVKQVYFL